MYDEKKRENRPVPPVATQHQNDNKRYDTQVVFPRHQIYQLIILFEDVG